MLLLALIPLQASLAFAGVPTVLAVILSSACRSVTAVACVTAKMFRIRAVVFLTSFLVGNCHKKPIHNIPELFPILWNLCL
jgi:hypothetical protein